MAESLKNKTVKGVAWSAADAFLGHGVTFLVGIVLARLLSPSEYGLIAICLIFTTVLHGIVDSGFSNSLIRKKDVTSDDYNTMFITNMMMSIVLYCLLFVTAPLVASFFERAELVSLVRAVGLILLLQALSITQSTILTKRIDFKTKTKASFFSAVVSGAIGIIMAYLGCGVWSLVGQKLSEKLLYTICLWVLNRWWPNFTFSRNSFNYMWGYGWKLMVSGLLNNIWNQIYQVVVGKCYSPATLGQYGRSREYAHIFSQTLTGIVQRVTFPALAALQDDKTRLVAAYRKIIRVSMFLTTICMIPLGAVAEPLIYCLIGPKWYEASTYLPLICLSMSLHPLHAINLNMLQVQGRSDLFLYLEIVKKCISIIPISLGIFVGIYWMLVGSIIAGIISFFLNSYYTGRDLGYSSRMQIKDVMPSYKVAFLIAIPIFFLKYLSLSQFAILFLQLLIGAMIFFCICQKFDIYEYNELKNILRKYLRHKK